MEYTIKIYEDDVCIGINDVTKEKAIEIQDVLKGNRVDYEKVITAVLRWNSLHAKYQKGSIKEKPLNTEEFIEYLSNL